MRREPAFEDIPGTLLFDAERSRGGYQLNMFCMSLMTESNRSAFTLDPGAYMQRRPMTEEQYLAIRDRAWNTMLGLGGNIYFTSKLGAYDKMSFQQLAAKMSGMTQHKYADTMIVEGNRNKSKWKNRG
jgi:protocatechuate 4,5-dioxygenase alpha chain